MSWPVRWPACSMPRSIRSALPDGKRAGARNGQTYALDNSVELALGSRVDPCAGRANCRPPNRPASLIRVFAQAQPDLRLEFITNERTVAIEYPGRRDEIARR